MKNEERRTKNEEQRTKNKGLIRKALLGAVAVEEFFEEAFVGERVAVEAGAELLQEGLRHPPGHPLAPAVSQLPAPS